MNIARSERRYIPAAGHHWSLPLYDPLTKLLGVDRARHQLVDQAELRASHRVLDIGCGTGSLAVLITQRRPDVDVVGLDPDPKALARARRKAERAGVSIQFDQGFADALRYPDASFDRVFSSFMFHHLQGEDKPKTLREVYRVLKPGGRLEMVDFGGPDRGHESLLARLLHSHRLLQDNAEERVLTMTTDAGFADPRRVSDRGFLFGRVAYYQASRSA